MLIDTPTRSLGFFDTAKLAQRVLATDERGWLVDNRRQDEYEVHAQTQSIILVFFSGWPEVTVSHAPGWEGYSDTVMPLIDAIVARNYPPGGLVLRAVLARLQPGCSIDLHIDSHPSFSIAHRIHVPILTNPEVRFIVGEERISTRPGHAFELNNKMAHRVANDGDTTRVHLIFDYAPE